MEAVYFDHNATTPLVDEVVEAMLAFMRGPSGNPSTGHVFGKAARQGVDRAREQVASALHCDPDEIVFTGGASEANNLAIKGTAWARRERGLHLVHSGVEHPSVRNACRWLADEGWEVSTVGVDRDGRVNADAVTAGMRPDTVLAALMVAQNEVGTIMPVREMAVAARERGVTSLADASQAVGKIPVDVRALGVDLCSVAAHKFHGPKGVGALYVRRGTKLVPLVHGAAHEHGLRAGTENIPGVVGMGAAIAWATRTLEDRTRQVRLLCERLLQGLRARIPDLVLSGDPLQGLPNTLHVSIPGVDSTRLLAAIPELGASTGAACHWGVTEPSAVLLQMGVPRDVAMGAIRFSLGPGNTTREVDFVVERVAAEVARSSAS